MKLWHWVVTGTVTAFCLTIGGFNAYLFVQLVKKHGRIVGTALWKEWKL